MNHGISLYYSLIRQLWQRLSRRHCMASCGEICYMRPSFMYHFMLGLFALKTSAKKVVAIRRFMPLIEPMRKAYASIFWMLWYPFVYALTSFILLLPLLLQNWISCLWILCQWPSRKRSNFFLQWRVRMWGRSPFESVRMNNNLALSLQNDPCGFIYGTRLMNGWNRLQIRYHPFVKNKKYLLMAQVIRLWNSCQQSWSVG